MPGRTPGIADPGDERAYPRRSLLYTPADAPERMAKAPELDVDGAVFDLDDSVPDAHLPTARENVVDVVANNDFADTEVILKLDAYETDFWLDDLETAFAAGVDAVALPKVQRPREIATVADLLERHGGGVELLVYVETPTAVVRLPELVEVCRERDPVTGMVCSWGDDIMRFMGTIPPRFGDTSVGQPLGNWMSNYVAMAATAAGLDPISYPHVAIRDEESLRKRATYADETGYVGQLALHPGQLDVINDAFTPDEDDVARALRLVEAFEAAESDSLVLEDVFVDQAMVAHYEQLVARYEETTGRDASALAE
jgi:citrate lyase subunit beta/citryl-CoA lyase